jgi:hypothetical protein
MHELDLLDGMLREVEWLWESAILRRRLRSLGLERLPISSPLFCEVVIEWDDSTLGGTAESIGC